MNALIFLGVAAAISVVGVLVISLTNRSRRPTDAREIANFSAHMAALRRHGDHPPKRRAGRR